MQSHNLIQGTPEWLAYRRDHFNASDAPAMMNVSPYKTRAALLRELHTGLAPEVSPQSQYLFDRGHKFEAASRGMAETILGDELYPIVGSLDKLSASFDGLTMDELTAWEHKTLNNELRACFRQMETIAPAHREHAAGRELPIYHRIQMEQQLHVSGAERVLFTASRWSDEGELLEAVHCWYYPDMDLRNEILTGWVQFSRDLAGFVSPAAVPIAPEGRAPNVLPALRIEVRGEVTASNLAEFKTTALAAIRSVRRDLATDQDFADAEAAVKWCGDVETRLEAAKQHALSQTSTIDALFRTIDEISAEARRVRLDVDKLVKARKESIREEVVRGAMQALRTHIEQLAIVIAPHSAAVPADFTGAVKGKRTVEGLRNAVDSELARAKAESTALADRIRASMNMLAFHSEYRFLFNDAAALVTKAPDDLAAIITNRIEAHKLSEARRLDAERERIRAEEQARAEQRAAAVRLEEQRQAEAKARDDQAEADRRARAIAAASATPPAEPLRPDGNPYSKAVMHADEPPPAAPAPQAVAPAPIANELATLKLGTICDRLGFTVNAAFVETTLGIAAADRAGSARLFRESDFQRICAGLVAHITRNAARDWRAAQPLKEAA